MRSGADPGGVVSTIASDVIRRLRVFRPESPGKITNQFHKAFCLVESDMIWRNFVGFRIRDWHRRPSNTLGKAAKSKKTRSGLHLFEQIKKRWALSRSAGSAAHAGPPKANPCPSTHPRKEVGRVSSAVFKLLRGREQSPSTIRRQMRVFFSFVTNPKW